MSSTVQLPVGSPTPAETFTAWAVLLTGPEFAYTTAKALRVAIAGVGDVMTRDALIAWFTPGTLTLDVFGEHTRQTLAAVLPPSAELDPDELTVRLTQVCRVLPARPTAAAAFTVCGAILWWLREEQRAWAALQSALDVEPGYRLAVLMSSMIALRVEPVHRALAEWAPHD